MEELPPSEIFNKLEAMSKKWLISCLFFLLALSGVAQGTEEMMAKEYFRNKEFEKAEIIFKKIYFSNPNIRSNYSNYFNTLMQLQKFEEAEKIAKKQIKKNQDNSLYHVDLARVYSRLNLNDKANKNLSLSINAAANNLASYDQLIEALTEYSFYDYALQAISVARQKFNEKSLFSYEASKIYNLQNNKQGIVEEQLNLFESNAFNEESIQQTFQDFFNDEKDYDLLKGALLQRMQQYPDQLFYQDMLIWTFIQQGNIDAALRQSVAMDKRLGENAERMFRLGEYCLNNQNYEGAIKCFEAVIQRQPSSTLYLEARNQLLFCKKEKIISGNFTQQDIELLKVDYQNFLRDFGQQSSTSKVMKEFAQLLALYARQAEEAIRLLNNIITQRMGTTSFQAACKIDLGDYYLLSGEIWEAALLYGQVDKAYKDEPLGQMAKFKNAKLSYFAGEFEWSKAQLDVLKGSTSQLYANDALNLSLLISDHQYIDSTFTALKLYSAAELFVVQNQFDQAIAKLDSIEILYPSSELADDNLWVKASISLKKQDWNQAISQMESLVAKYPESLWADDALLQIGLCYELKLKNNEQAMKSYKRLIEEYSGSLLETEARKRFRTLRGS